jgi:hypothetical protein
MRDASLPITLIIVGLVWLAWHFRFLPDVDWVIGIGFIVGGAGVLIVDGINKGSIVSGPILMGVGVAWLLHDQYRASWSVMIPLLLVLAGVLMLIARDPRIPERRSSASKTDPQ